MRVFIKIIKKIWHGILNAIAWLTQDNARLRNAKVKSRQDVIAAQMRFRHWR